MINQTLDNSITTTLTPTTTTTSVENTNMSNIDIESPISAATAEMVADLVAEMALDGNNNSEEMQSKKSNNEPGSSLPSSPSSASSSAGNGVANMSEGQLLYETILAGTTGNGSSLPIVDECFIGTLMHKM